MAVEQSSHHLSDCICKHIHTVQSIKVSRHNKLRQIFSIIFSEFLFIMVLQTIHGRMSPRPLDSGRPSSENEKPGTWTKCNMYLRFRGCRILRVRHFQLEDAHRMRERRKRWSRSENIATTRNDTHLYLLALYDKINWIYSIKINATRSWRWSHRTEVGEIKKGHLDYIKGTRDHKQ